MKDIDDAVLAIKWLGMLTDAERSSSVPMDALCSLLQEKLQFEDGEKDMVAMYHTVLGCLPDGSFERHTSRLLAFGNPHGDSAMAATVGYTTAAAAELILQGRVAETGVLIPTMEAVYTPMLTKLQELGVTFTEAVDKFK